MWRTKLAFAFLTLTLVGCTEPATNSAIAPAPKSDLELLAGDWVTVAHEFGGTSPSYETEHATYELTFGGHAVSEITSGETKNAKVVLDPNKSPKRISFEYPPHSASWGTYELSGDMLTITWAIGKNVEPNESEYARFVLQRAQ
jgi:uncharacterized protein (TIGR03067 family)